MSTSSSMFSMMCREPTSDMPHGATHKTPEHCDAHGLHCVQEQLIAHFPLSAAWAPCYQACTTSFRSPCRKAKSHNCTPAAPDLLHPRPLNVEIQT